MKARLPGLALAGLLLAGCGSTVQYTGSASTGDSLSTGGLTTGTPAGTNAPGAVVPGGTGLAAQGTTGAAQQPGTTQLPGGSGPTAGPVGSGGKAALSGRGFTATTIEVGISVSDDYNAFAGSFGLKGVTPSSSPQAMYAAVAADVNKHGGILGRKLVLVPHNYNTAQTLSDTASANQAACADWTQDHHVFAVLVPALVEDTLLSCLAKTSTPVIYGGGLDYPLHYQRTYSTYPLFWNIGQMLGERLDRLAIGRLVARGFFTPWDTLRGAPGAASTPVRIGIVGYDDSDGATQLASEKRELAKHHLAPFDVVLCPRAVQSKISCEQSAVLKFHSDGVTHVFNADLTFMTNANSQQYYPRHFVAVEPGVFEQNAPKKQLVGAMGEGYIPALDVDPSQWPADPSPSTTRCKKVMTAGGAPPTDASTLWNEEIVCDSVYVFRAGLELSGSLSTAALQAGLGALGATEPSALTWGTLLSPTNHASATVLRDIAFRTDIQHFAYVDKVNHGD